jgi:hypothetical protein
MTVAGQDARYRRVDARRERWLVTVLGTTVRIELLTRRGAARAEVDEGHAIIDSMRTEERGGGRLGFRLVFTLTPDDWDSG